jgi:hemin uptake protein HemP
LNPQPEPLHDARLDAETAPVVTDAKSVVTDAKQVAAETAPIVMSPSTGTLPKIVKFDALARCGDEIWIENEGQIYRLRKTRQGKLILTK